MTLSRWFFRLSQLNPVVEIPIILSYLLFFPKAGFIHYALGMAVMISIFAARAILFMKNMAYSSFSLFTAAANIALLFSCFFSHNPHNSFLLAADVLLLSFYFHLMFLDTQNRRRHFQWLAMVISVSSLLHVGDQFFRVTGQKSLIFGNPILQGVTSGIAALILFHFLLEKFKWHEGALLALNLAAVYVSQSKAAFIGVMALAAVLALNRARKWLPWIAGLLLLTIIIPNPMRDMVVFSIYKDPYAANRIDIWKCSLEMAADNLPLGVGLNNFADAAPKYNFRQSHGPANYFKVPEKSHNDILKLLAETGLAGLLTLIVLGTALGKKLLTPPIADIAKVVMLYLLFQACLFNLLFEPFFLFIFLFLLKNLLEENMRFAFFSESHRLIFSLLLVTVMAFGYVFPALARHQAGKFQTSRDAVAGFTPLNAALRLTPRDSGLYYLKARSLIGYFRKTGDLESFYDGLENLRNAQLYNRYLTDAYILESEFYFAFASARLNYEGLRQEITQPLERAQSIDPYDPFLRLRKAEILLLYRHSEEARSEALKALETEPEFVAALYFLQQHFGVAGSDRDFKTRMDKIRAKALRLKPEPGSYLDRLYSFPPGH